MTQVVRKGTLEEIIKELRRRIRILETSARTASVIATTIGYASVQDEGISLPSRTSIDFVGDGVNATDDPDNNRTIVTVTSDGASTADVWLYEEAIAYAGITGYTLTMLPVEGAVFADLNGLAMREGIDYTVDYATGIVTFHIPLTYSPPPSDVVMFRYESTGTVSPPPAPLPPTLISVTPTTVTAGSNVTLSIANMGATQDFWVVRIATSSTVLDCSVVSWSATTVVATIPDDPTLVLGQTYDCSIFIRDDTNGVTTNSLALTVNGTHYPGPSDAYGSSVFADAPLIYWRFSEPSGTAVADSSGYARVGAMSGSYTRGTPGLLISSPDLATNFGVSGEGYCYAAHDVGLETSAETIEFLSNMGGSGTRDVYQHDGRSRLKVAGGAGTYYVWDTGTSAWIAVGSTDSSWTFTSATRYLGVTYDGSTLIFYQDGVQYGAAISASMALPAGSGLVRFGAMNMNQGINTGDEFALYGAALDSARIGAHHAAGVTP